MRLRYSKVLIDELNKGTRVINIDESWLPHLNFRRRSWRKRGEANTIGKKQISYKVNVISAVDTEGNVYLSLTQFNTDSNVMMTFMSRLA